MQPNPDQASVLPQIGLLELIFLAFSRPQLCGERAVEFAENSWDAGLLRIGLINIATGEVKVVLSHPSLLEATFTEPQ